jgi:hypothetical protein
VHQWRQSIHYAASTIIELKWHVYVCTNEDNPSTMQQAQ